MPAQGTPSYDGDQIYERLLGIVRDYARWELFFARNGIEPTRVAYETLVEDPQACVDEVAAMFGLRGRTPIDLGQITLEIQRDALTDEWRARFLAERRNLGVLDAL
jgi:LPS sulfotransferase NodH